jgi:hypothetical protein
MSFLDAPAYKLEIKDVKDARDVGFSENQWVLTLHSKDLWKKKSESSSTPQLPDLTLNLSLVWIQGTVISTDSSILTISDGTLIL